ncbi:MAG: hypothetical protein LBK94_05830 [Prevotellaceae bacterium]|jgi:hypothetical protein|nr:hypothetical protein [Prevotellaceae bacterium]
MNNQEIENQKLIQAGLGREAIQKRDTFFRHVLLVSSSIFGILVSLHTSSSSCLHIRLVFLLSVVLLALGILLAGIVVYDHAMIFERARRDHYNAVEAAINGRGDTLDVFSPTKKRTLVCEKLSLSLLVLGIITLTVYTILETLS